MKFKPWPTDKPMGFLWQFRAFSMLWGRGSPEITGLFCPGSSNRQFQARLSRYLTMVLKPDGRVDGQLFIARQIAKKGSARRIPMHVDLAKALSKLHRDQGSPPAGPVILSQRGGNMTARGVVNWFRATYAELGLVGCSSHSGRRTWITRAARLLPRTGGSLRDVQELAGHRSLTTTERYIQGDRDAQRKLVALI